MCLNFNDFLDLSVPSLGFSALVGAHAEHSSKMINPGKKMNERADDIHLLARKSAKKLTAPCG
jgi:hypothetical protein